MRSMKVQTGKIKDDGQYHAYGLMDQSWWSCGSDHHGTINIFGPDRSTSKSTAPAIYVVRKHYPRPSF